MKAKVLKFKIPVPPSLAKVQHPDDLVSALMIQWQTTYDMALKERKNERHLHSFTETQLVRGGPSLCMTCLQTVVLPRKEK